MENLLFYLILAIIIIDFAIERFLEYLNARKMSPQLPAELKGIYDEEKYRQSQLYHRENILMGQIKGGLSLLIILAMIIFGGFAVVDQWARGISDNPVLIALVFFGILMFAMDLINTPFDIYDTFVIEEKYGFNKTTPLTFVTDKLKGWLLGAIIGGGLLALIVWFYQVNGAAFWYRAWILVSVFSVFMAMFYSSLIVPLFNKQTPLEEGELKDAIQRFAHKAGFQLDNIFVIDGSKRSTKANAYFSGLGKKKRIVLFDTLIQDMETEEIVAVLAHEIGHYKKKHILKSMAGSIINTGVTLFILSLLVDSPALSQVLGASEPGFHLALITFTILYSPVSTVLGLWFNHFSRKNEFEADDFCKRYYQAEPLIEALKKLSVKNLSNLTPHPLYVFFHYSHPPLLKRIENLRK